MRYVRLKTFARKIADEEIGDEQTIKDILSVLRDKELDCSLRISNDPEMGNCRILEVGDDDFRFLVIKNRSSLKRRAKISDLSYLEVQTSDSEVAATKPEVSRWLLLEPTCMQDVEETEI